MTYKQIKNLQEKEFKRLCGVRPKLFNEMVEVLKQELPKSRQKGGQQKFGVEDQLLMALEYWREYRTYFHIGKSWHDFQLFKRSKVKPIESIEILADKGYQGIKKIHTLSYTPIKKSKNKPLSSREKEYNRQLAKPRIYIEHIIRCLKIFRILAQPYRNRRRRFGLRFNLIVTRS